MKNITTTYYKFTLESIPFKEIPSLENITAKFLYCSLFPLVDFMRLDLCLLTVYNLFDHDNLSPKDIQGAQHLFGDVISDKLPVRGKAKCIKVGSEEREISPENLPHLKYNSSDNWFYMKNGNYVAMHGIKSQFESVKHLEGISIYAENILRLRIVVELLKRNVKEGILALSEDEYKKIGFKVLRSDPSLIRADDKLIRDGVDNWISSMLEMPLYEDIPSQYRGRIIT